jgi:twinkle protein
LMLVSHLRRPQGDRGHEQGAETTLAQLRGSHAIAQLSDVVVGAERNQQHDDPGMRDVTLLRVLKNRVTGETGPTTALRYSRDTGRLTEIPFSYGEDGELVVQSGAESVVDAY